MLKFYGDISEDCKTIILKNIKRSSSALMFLISCFISIPFIILTICYDWIFILAVLIVLSLPLFQYFSYTGSTLNLIFPTQVIIDNDVLTCQGKSFSVTRSIHQIKKIIDYGPVYQIMFKFPHRSQNFIIQKDLIKHFSILKKSSMII